MMAKVGANTVHKIKREIIAKLFGFFLIIIASRFLYDYFNFKFFDRIVQFSQFFEANYL